MNLVVLTGRLTRDAEVRYAGNSVIAEFTLAVDRDFKTEGQPTADFIRCKEWTKHPEWYQQWAKKGVKLEVIGRIQTGSYKDRDGKTVYTTDVMVERKYFAESKNAQNAQNAQPTTQPKHQEWLDVADDLDDVGLPFN